jgi:hypothetical protein
MIELNTAYKDLIADAQSRRPDDKIIKVSVMEDPFDYNVSRLIIEYASHSKRMYRVDPSSFEPDKPKKPKRLRCEYCGRIATTDRPTCEGCGAVLPWEMPYEA